MSRTNRYRKRCAADGDAAEYVDAENPLPGFIDPITLEPVVTPAVSSHGHVMGLATWKVRLIWQPWLAASLSYKCFGLNCSEAEHLCLQLHVSVATHG